MLPQSYALNKLAQALELDYDEVYEILTKEKKAKKERVYGN